jgi:hypothetical protein
MLLQRKVSGKERPYDSFIAGLLGGYTVFGRSRSSVNQQICIYVFARVVLAFATLAVMPRADGPMAAVGDIYGHGVPTRGSKGGWGLVGNERLHKIVRKNSWPVFATLSWAFVMWLFRWNPEVLQPSLRSSMHYMLVLILNERCRDDTDCMGFNSYETADEWEDLRTFIWHNKR